MIKLNFLTLIFQKYLDNKDIRQFKGSIFYYLIFRLIRNFLSQDIIINIYNFKILGSIKKNKTSHFLLKKCEFGDYHELSVIEKLSRKNKLIFLDCGCNYGFYSFFAASLSEQNIIFSIEASYNTYNELIKNLKINHFTNINIFNNAISNTDSENISLNESENDWESSQSHKNFKLSKTSIIKSIKIDTLLKSYDFINYKSIIKLDIEGNEINAIDGALEFIKKASPLIIIEFSKYIFNKKDNIEYLKNFLIRYDYLIYDTKCNKVNLENVLMKINRLNTKHHTIGNYYLIKNSLENIEAFLNE